MGRRPRGLDALEIGIQANIGHGGEHFGETPAPWTRQGAGQDGPMFSLRAAPMRACSLLQSTHNLVINISYQQIGHGAPPIRLISMIANINCPGEATYPPW
jgi:hypothetical protein